MGPLNVQNEDLAEILQIVAIAKFVAVDMLICLAIPAAIYRSALGPGP